MKPGRPTTPSERSQLSRDVLGWLQVIGLVLLTLGLVYLAVYVGTELLVHHIDEKTEARWFGWMFPDTDTPKDAAFQRAQSILRRLTAGADLRPLPYRLFLVEDLDTPNAVAVPGGGVGVTPALLQVVHSEIGLATVLAHELGHQHYRHGLKRAGRTLLWTVLLNLVMGKADTTSMHVALQLTAASYSRSQEQAADVFALTLVHQVYGETQGALEFFEIMQREYEQQNPRWMHFFSSHPPTAERIAYLQRLQQQLRQQP
jgi:predicted Zn-dependent protease